jgi:hypothetical protein
MSPVISAFERRETVLPVLLPVVLRVVLLAVLRGLGSARLLGSG